MQLVSSYYDSLFDLAHQDQRLIDGLLYGLNLLLSSISEVLPILGFSNNVLAFLARKSNQSLFDFLVSAINPV
jgi:hypothetical protein